MGNYLLFGNWVIQQISKLGLLIDAIVYTFTAKAYEVFLLVSEAQLFDDGSELLSEITSRIYSILGIVMLFVLAYNIIKLILNPDKLSSSDDSSLQGIAKNLVISIIILVLLPTAFKYIYQFQNRVLETNVLSRMILGGTSSSDGEFSIKSAGRDVAITILSTFLHPVNNENTIFTANECQNPGIENKPAICDEYVGAMIDSIDNGKIFQFATNKTITNAIGSDMEYLWPASLAAGVIALYLFLSFALDLGVRVVKLGVLQIIAPIPVISRVTKPKGGVFDKWFKEISKTYLMVFERLIVVYFAVFMLQIICSDNAGIIANLTKTSASGGLVLLLAKVILILGTLKFAKDAPKLIEDLIGTKLPDWRIQKKLDDNTYAKKLATSVGTAGFSVGGNVVKAFKTGNWGQAGKALLSLPISLSRGWNNGDLKEFKFKNLGEAITKSRVETEKKTNQWADYISHPIKNAKKQADKTKDFISGNDGQTQLDAFTTLDNSLEEFFGLFKSKSSEKARETAKKTIREKGQVSLPGVSSPVTSEEYVDYYFDRVDAKDMSQDIVKPEFKMNVKKRIDKYYKELKEAMPKISDKDSLERFKNIMSEYESAMNLMDQELTKENPDSLEVANILRIIQGIKSNVEIEKRASSINNKLNSKNEGQS